MSTSCGKTAPTACVSCTIQSGAQHTTPIRTTSNETRAARALARCRYLNKPEWAAFDSRWRRLLKFDLRLDVRLTLELLGEKGTKHSDCNCGITLFECLRNLLGEMQTPWCWCGESATCKLGRLVIVLIGVTAVELAGAGLIGELVPEPSTSPRVRLPTEHRRKCNQENCRSENFPSGRIEMFHIRRRRLYDDGVLTE